jgi:anti-sigma factor RsiW
MNWTCEQIEARLSEYVDRLLTAEERRGFEAHAASCARCAPLVARVSGLVSAMHHLEPIEPPMGLERRIIEATLGARATKGTWRAWFGWAQFLRQPKFAYGAISLIVTLVVVSQAVGIQWRKPTLADLNPVNMYRNADRNAHLLYARGTKFVTDLRVVYEIQSRLRTEGEAQPAPESKPKNAPGSSDGPDKKSPQNMNHAGTVELETLADVIGVLPERSSR